MTKADEQSSDVDLMTRLGAGDNAALGVLAERHQSRVTSLAYRLLGDWHRAEDVAQETFLRLHQAARHYRPEAKFTTWLYRIVYNLSIDEQRRAMGRPAARETPEPEGQDVSASDSAERREAARLVRDAVNSLPERQRRVLILHRYEGLRHSEIVAVTGWSRSAVESLLVRAYEHLRRSLEKYQDFAP
ncbi:MAG: sigma-70 family RNA polymerase sigma factor [Sedimentisphaerales bacterium]|nr:sigma-70 family RNA polymerase sigma factor [Sedimentisphaerales bacterium]